MSWLSCTCSLAFTNIFLGAKCYPAFLKDYGDSAEAVMLTSIAYARLDGSEESLRKRGRAFDRYVGKVGNVVSALSQLIDIMPD